MSDQPSDWAREECVPSKEILETVLSSGHDDFTAMEDIIDNSIEALSSVIGEAGYKPEIKVKISDTSIEILDNGCGMSHSQARNAMRLGSHIVHDISHDETHFLFGSGRLGHVGVGGTAGACKLGSMLEYITRQTGDSKVTVVRCHPGVSLWEQEFMMREPIGEEIKMSHFTKVTISDLKCDPKLRFCYDAADTTFFRLRARLFCTYFFLINRPGDKFDTDPDGAPPSHRHGLWTLKKALKNAYPCFHKCEPTFSFHLHINGSNILRAMKGDGSDCVESNCPLNCILNFCNGTMVDHVGVVRTTNVISLDHPDASTPPGPTPRAVAVCMFDSCIDGKSSFEDQFEQNRMSRLALLDIHNTSHAAVRSDECIERTKFRCVRVCVCAGCGCPLFHISQHDSTFVFWSGRLLRHVDMHKTASNPKAPSFLQNRTTNCEGYAPEVADASERVITFVFFNEAFRPDPAKTTLRKDVQPFQSIFETELGCERDALRHAQLLECITYWKTNHDEGVMSRYAAAVQELGVAIEKLAVELPRWLERLAAARQAKAAAAPATGIKRERENAGDAKYTEGNRRMAVASAVGVHPLPLCEPDDVPRRPHAGIQNQGATCFISAVLQCWYHTPLMRAVVYRMSDPGSASSVLLELQRVFWKLQHSELPVRTQVDGRTALPSCCEVTRFLLQALTRSLGWADEQSRTVQQDAHEFAVLLLDRLFELAAGGGRPPSQEATALTFLFTGKLRTVTSSTTFPECKTEDPFRFWSLEIEDFKSVQAAIQSCARHSTLTDYKPEGFAVAGNAQLTVTWPVLPAVLQLHLKRFSINVHGKSVKYNGPLQFTETLDLTQYSDASAVYKLYGVVVHLGSSLASGHYYAYIRPACTGDQWFKFNDGIVTAATSADAIAGTFGGGVAPSAYMLMYMRQRDVTLICRPLSPDAIPTHLSSKFTTEEAEELRLSSLVHVRYCTSDDLLAVQGIGLLPINRPFATILAEATCTVGGLRAQFSQVLGWPLGDVMLMSYTPSPPFSLSYEIDAASLPVAHWSKLRNAPEVNVVMFVCHRNRICNVQLGLQRVVVVKAFRDTGGRDSLTVQGLLCLPENTLRTGNHAVVYQQLQAAIHHTGSLYLETDGGRGDPEQITAVRVSTIDAGSVIVAVHTQPQPFEQFYRDARAMCTLLLRHAAAPGEVARPQITHKCLPDARYKIVVDAVKAHLQAEHVRLLKHDIVSGAAVLALDDLADDAPVDTLFKRNRGGRQEYVLHYEVLSCPATQLAHNARVVAFVCARDVCAHTWDMMSRQSTASDVCRFYTARHPGLVGVNLRVLILERNFLCARMQEQCVEQVALMGMRVEEVPVLHADLPPGSELVRVHM